MNICEEGSVSFGRANTSDGGKAYALAYALALPQRTQNPKMLYKT